MNDYTDEDLIAKGLNAQANYIETGNILFSHQDIESMGKDKPRGLNAKIKPLTMEQMELVIRLRKLAKKYQGN